MTNSLSRQVLQHTLLSQEVKIWMKGIGMSLGTHRMESPISYRYRPVLGKRPPPPPLSKNEMKAVIIIIDIFFYHFDDSQNLAVHTNTYMLDEATFSDRFHNVSFTMQSHDQNWSIPLN